MTRQKHLKERVRSRMKKTRERYAAARRHILAQVKTPQTKHPFHYPGSIPATVALRIMLNAVGARDPHNNQPITEEMLFGIAGGIGAGVFAFHYAKENFSSFFVAGRNSWQDDLAYLKSACNRFGVPCKVKETNGAKTAEKQLREAVAENAAVIAWVDMALLPWRGLPELFQGGGYHVVTIYGIDGIDGIDGDEALIGDMTDEPMPLSMKDLAAARQRIKKQKNRLLTVAPPSKSIDLTALVRQGLKACHDGLAKQRMSNFTLEAFRTWADRMHGTSGKDSWAKIFPPGPLLWRGLFSMYLFIEQYGTGGGLCRPMFADFFAEAASALNDDALKKLGERYATLGERWSRLAESALPDDVELFRETKSHFTRIAELTNSSGDNADELRQTWESLEDLGRNCADGFPLDESQCDALRADLKSQIVEIYEMEKAAHQAIADYLS